jgi:hypothetical protein
MKKILFFTLLSIIIFSCQNNKKEIIDNKTVETIEIDKSEKVERLFKEFESLYNELIGFKDKADFKEFGFGEGGPYNKWLKNVEALGSKPDSKLLASHHGVLVGELETLGLEYVSSHGKETDVTKFFNNIFTEAISPTSVEEIETVSGISNYDNLKKDYKLFGKWKISNTIAKDSYPYEIYSNGNEFIGVIPQDDYKTEILEKKGNDYFIKGNKSGEYYKIDTKMNMSLYDNDGELASMGYKATKK